MSHAGNLLLYLHVAIFLNALQISVELTQCTEEKIDLELQRPDPLRTKKRKLFPVYLEIQNDYPYHKEI